MRQLKISRSITSRDSLSLEKYLKEISRAQVISSEEEVGLMELIRRGDRSAKEKLIRSNLRFVVSVAKQYQGQGLSLSDLVNEGNLGLIRAVDTFDATKGFRFISFAVWWIRQGIIHALINHSRLIRLPLNKVSLRSRIRQASLSLEQQFDRPPSASELAEFLCIPEQDVERCLSLSENHLSLDAPVNEDEEGCLLDVVEDANAERSDNAICHKESLQFELSRSLDMLPPRHRQMLCCLFGIGMEYPMSLDEVGKKYDITPERARQIRDKSLQRLRESGNLEQLRSFLRA
jgi:RNA polymerase primary sigma factor